MMYNRYVPQSDGSFRRTRIEPPKPTPPKCPPKEKEDPKCCPAPPPPCLPEPPKPSCHKEYHDSAAGFLRNLLPRDMDTGDLIVILLLLLLAGDCEEDRSTALLTLVLYLFM
jgi:hypothetical protein